MVVTLALGIRAARCREFAGHRAWMIRSYAIGLMALAWGINPVVAEWAVLSPRTRPVGALT